MNKIEEQAELTERSINPSFVPHLQPLKVRQSVKYIINLMGDLSTLDLMYSVDALVESCTNHNPNNVCILKYKHIKFI